MNRNTLRHTRPSQTHLIILLAVLALAGCGRAARPPGDATAVKLFVDELGLYRVTGDDLAAAGFRLDANQLGGLRLRHRGQAVPVHLQQDGDDYAVLFYAEPQAGEFSAADVYWLEHGPESGARMAERAVEPPRGDPFPAAFRSRLTLEEDLLYFPNAVGDSHWYWYTLTAPASQSLTLTVPGYDGGPALIEVAVAGLTENEHKVTVTVNGQPAGETTWSGATPHTLQASTSSLAPGENTLEVGVPGGVAPAEVDLIDSISIVYPRAYTAEGGVLVFDGQGSSVRVEGFTSAAPLLYDITDPLEAEVLTGAQIESSNGATALAFYDQRPLQRYLVLDPQAALQPSEIRAAQTPAVDLRAAGTQADYVILAPAEFFDALAPLVQHREAGGLRVLLVDVEHVYDAFSDGTPEPAALRDFLSYVQTNWTAPAPRFVLLVGKASYDYRDNLGGQNKSLVPTYLVPTPHLGQAASDNWFVAASAEDTRPQMAIGRIPAKTPEQVRAVVDKILAYEAALAEGAEAWRRNAVFVTDNREPIYDMSSDVLAGGLAPGMEARKVYLSAFGGDVEAARAEIVRQWNDGALLMTYIGHGSIDTWAAGPLFGSAYIDQVRNAGRLPILLTPTCLDGYFYHPERDSLAEALLFKTDGGIVAGLVPTGLSLPTGQDLLMARLFEALFAEGEGRAQTLGEAVTRAKQEVDVTAPEVREVVETFVILGDPALRWEVGE